MDVLLAEFAKASAEPLLSEATDSKLPMHR